MRLLLFLFLLLFYSLSANSFFATEENSTLVQEEQQKVLYLSYEEIPKRVIKGEVFSVTIKTLSTVRDYIDVSYSLSNFRGLEVLSEIPERRQSSKYLFDTFYFIAKSENAKLPDFEAKLVTDTYDTYNTTLLTGETLNIISLNPRKNFAHVIANSFELMEYKTSSYDSEHNIVIFVARAFNSDLGAFKLEGIEKQGIESISGDHVEARITYYAVIDKKIENLSFSYFNLHTNDFLQVALPIIVEEDSVVTQTDLKPTDQSKEQIKLAIALGVLLLALVIFIWRRKYIYLILLIFPLAYIVVIMMPTKDICIEKGTNIYLLPLKNGTIFETTTKRMFLQKEGSIKGYMKVKLDNEKIGWVENENICTY